MSSVPRAVARSNEVYRRNEMPVGAITEHAPLPPEHRRWSLQQARDWYAALPWLVGCNFTPSYAINQIDFWQAGVIRHWRYRS